MSVEEKRKELIQKIEVLPNNIINNLWDSFNKEETKENLMVDDKTFQKLLTENSKKYSEVYKQLA